MRRPSVLLPARYALPSQFLGGHEALAAGPPSQRWNDRCDAEEDRSFSRSSGPAAKLGVASINTNRVRLALPRR